MNQVATAVLNVKLAVSAEGSRSDAGGEIGHGPLQGHSFTQATSYVEP